MPLPLLACPYTPPILTPSSAFTLSPYTHAPPSVPTPSPCLLCQTAYSAAGCPITTYVLPTAPELWHQCPERQLHGIPCFNPRHHEIIWGSWFLPGKRDTLQFVSSWGTAEQAELCIERGIYLSPTPLLQVPSQLCLHLEHHSAQAVSSHLLLSGFWAPGSQS